VVVQFFVSGSGAYQILVGLWLAVFVLRPAQHEREIAPRIRA